MHTDTHTHTLSLIYSLAVYIKCIEQTITRFFFVMCPIPKYICSRRYIPFFFFIYCIYISVLVSLLPLSLSLSFIYPLHLFSLFSFFFPLPSHTTNRHQVTRVTISIAHRNSKKKRGRKTKRPYYVLFLYALPTILPFLFDSLVIVFFLFEPVRQYRKRCENNRMAYNVLLSNLKYKLLLYVYVFVEGCFVYGTSWRLPRYYIL